MSPTGLLTPIRDVHEFITITFIIDVAQVAEVHEQIHLVLLTKKQTWQYPTELVIFG